MFNIVQQQLYLHISLKVHILCVPDPRILCEASREVEEEHGLDCQHLTFFPVLNEVSPLPEDFSEQCMDTQLILKELEPTEEVRVTHIHLEPQKTHSRVYSCSVCVCVCAEPDSTLQH